MLTVNPQKNLSFRGWKEIENLPKDAKQTGSRVGFHNLTEFYEVEGKTYKKVGISPPATGLTFPPSIGLCGDIRSYVKTPSVLEKGLQLAKRLFR